MGALLKEKYSLLKRIKAISSKMKPHCARASFAFKVMATKVNVFLFHL